MEDHTAPGRHAPELVLLAGPVLRVPGRTVAEVTAALDDLPAELGTEPVTLEERFFELVAGG